MSTVVTDNNTSNVSTNDTMHNNNNNITTTQPYKSNYIIKPSTAFYYDIHNVQHNSNNNNNIKEHDYTQQELNILPQFKQELNQYLQQYNTIEGRNQLGQNNTSINHHWRINYNSDDLPYLYALRDYLVDTSKPFYICKTKQEFEQVYPIQYGQWPIDINTLPDRLCIRFLRAKKHNIQLSVKQLASTLAWRSLFGVDELASLPREPCFNKLMGIVSAEFHNYDIDGRPIFINNSGSVNVDLLASTVRDNDIMISHVHMMEQCLQDMELQSIKHNKRIDKLVTVQNIRGLSLQHRKLAHIFTNVNIIDSTYYPEFVHQIIIINAPTVFSTMFNTIIKPFLDPITAQKFYIFNDDQSKYLTLLTQTWGLHNVPTIFGGQCNHSKIQCFPTYTSPKPKSNEIIQIIHQFTGQTGLLTIKANKIYIIESEYGAKQRPFNDSAHDRTIYYSFKTLDDIYFSIIWIDAIDTHNNKTIKQSTHIRSNDGLIQGQYTVQRNSIGCIQLRFDNTHSSWNTKHVEYNVKIVAHTEYGDSYL